ncbi:MAG: hypothetical protein HOO06_03140 [Bdellovibrionaceae bacterium]|jgi:hypothetical protein|nr:hypothetical protein [Pseudobdellovibrionaceae bacterium]
MAVSIAFADNINSFIKNITLGVLEEVLLDDFLGGSILGDTIKDLRKIKGNISRQKVRKYIFEVKHFPNPSMEKKEKASSSTFYEDTYKTELSSNWSFQNDIQRTSRYAISTIMGLNRSLPDQVRKNILKKFSEVKNIEYACQTLEDRLAPALNEKIAEVSLAYPDVAHKLNIYMPASVLLTLMDFKAQLEMFDKESQVDGTNSFIMGFLSRRHTEGGQNLLDAYYTCANKLEAVLRDSFVDLKNF